MPDDGGFPELDGGFPGFDGGFPDICTIFMSPCTRGCCDPAGGIIPYCTPWGQSCNNMVGTCSAATSQCQ